MKYIWVSYTSHVRALMVDVWFKVCSLLQRSKCARRDLRSTSDPLALLHKCHHIFTAHMIRVHEHRTHMLSVGHRPFNGILISSTYRKCTATRTDLKKVVPSYKKKPTVFKIPYLEIPGIHADKLGYTKYAVYCMDGNEEETCLWLINPRGELL